jgi:hypothetical protein
VSDRREPSKVFRSSVPPVARCGSGGRQYGPHVSRRCGAPYRRFHSLKPATHLAPQPSLSVRRRTRMVSTRLRQPGMTLPSRRRLRRRPELCPQCAACTHQAIRHDRPIPVRWSELRPGPDLLTGRPGRSSGEFEGQLEGGASSRGGWGLPWSIALSSRGGCDPPAGSTGWCFGPDSGSEASICCPCPGAARASCAARRCPLSISGVSDTSCRTRA